MFSRFRKLDNYGREELGRLRESRVAVVGVGATGSVIAENLARHGVSLRIVDRDYLEINDCYSSNLYAPDHCRKAMPKAKVASEKLSAFTETEYHVESLNAGNISLLENADIVMDGTDNLETRLLIDEYCRRESKPWIYTAALGEKAYSMLLEESCFSCILEHVKGEKLGTCETEGIMREVSSGIASRSSMKAVKYLCGKEVEEKLETYSGERFDIRESGCEVCRGKSFPHLEKSRKTISMCGENKFQLKKDFDEEVIERVKEGAEEVTENSYLVKADLGERQMTLFRSGRIIVEAKDQGHAESIVSEVAGI